jgi:hypothetical protein
MAFLIGGANSAADDAYEVANSCRFNNDDSDHMHKTPGSAGNRRTWTVSVWVKKSLVGGSTRKAIFGTADTEVNGDGGCLLRFENGDGLKFESDGGQVTVVETNALYRDPAAWMHVVLAVDTTQGTAANRVKIYINGVQETSLATSTYPAQNKDYHWNNTVVNYVGAYDDSGDIAVPFDGYMAEFVSIDGSALTPSSFGEYNEDSPTIWQPIDVSGLTFGTNGFYLDFEDSSNLGNDANGGTDLTEVNILATNQATDSPTNNFCTLNPLDVCDADGRTLSEGNLDFNTTAGNNGHISGTLAVAGSGKWYFETKISAQSGSASSSAKYGNVGVKDINVCSFSAGDAYYIYSDGRKEDGVNTTNSAHPGYSTNDIVQVALDLDNARIFFGLNGNWGDNDGNFDETFGDATAFFTSISTSKFWTPYLQKNVTADNVLTLSSNFGSPSFSISSANADGNGYGSFEYAVPSGYYALCTKNLAEFG